jgi:hypothetical protein
MRNDSRRARAERRTDTAIAGSPDSHCSPIPPFPPPGLPPPPVPPPPRYAPRKAFDTPKGLWQGTPIRRKLAPPVRGFDLPVRASPGPAS